MQPSMEQVRASGAPPETSAVLRLAGVSLVRDGRTILDRIDWEVDPGERWVVLGPNGSGKTSLCRIASLHLHPSRGTVDVLGERFGRVDARALRARIGMTSQALADQMRPGLTATDIVLTGRHAALAPWWHRYDEADRTRARALLSRFGCGALAASRYATLSAGERQRVLLARALMAEPALLVLDEPTAGLDLTGREQLVSMLADVAADRGPKAIVLVTHHVDEIPPGFTHALILSEGRIVAAGPAGDTLTADTLSRGFGLPLALERHGGRWFAWGAAGAPSAS